MLDTMLLLKYFQRTCRRDMTEFNIFNRTTVHVRDFKQFYCCSFKNTTPSDTHIRAQRVRE